jgi:pimeloyl-ACP methyl ester carboxylesterase
MGVRKLVRADLHRDNQQWMLDWVIEQTGKTYHFAGESRGELPREVRSHAMIAKHTAKRARTLAGLATEAEATGHRHAALDLWFKASLAYARAQHPVFETGPEKARLHGKSIECYDHVRALAPYTVERVEIPFDDAIVTGNLHLCGASEQPAPLVFFIPGCDMTKEMFPHPQANPAAQRGYHLFSFDGPGQGEANLNNLKLTSDNYERAVVAAIDTLIARPEIAADKVALFGLSFGSYWAFRAAAALGDRIAALAAPWASLADKRLLMDVDSPRYKQLFAYLTGANSEAELDQYIRACTVEDAAQTMRTPTLLAVGEYDPRSPLRDILDVFDMMSCDKELWVFEDQHHPGKVLASDKGSIWSLDIYPYTLDWIGDRFEGRPIQPAAAVRRIGGSAGPYSPADTGIRQWFDDL